MNWFDKSAEVYRLFVWMRDQYEQGEDIAFPVETTDVAYFLSKPWKWSGEYQLMLEDEAKAVVQAVSP